MNNIKLFMLLIMAATSSVALAQETTSYEFETEDNGSTLVINGKGDLTNYSTNHTYKVFTDYAVDNVFLTDHGTSVSANGLYNASATYYKGVSTYTQLFTDGVLTNGDYLNNVTTTASWKSNVSDVYIYPAWIGNEIRLWDETKCNVNNTYIYKGYPGSTESLWNSNASAANTYIYPVYISSQDEWSASSNVYLYSISEEPSTADVWTTSALTADNVYIYPVTYNPNYGNPTYAWNTSKTTNKYLYEVYYDGSKLVFSSNGETYATAIDVSDSNEPSYDNRTYVTNSAAMAAGTGSYVSWTHYIIVSDNQLLKDEEITIGTNCSFATADFIVDTTPIQVTATRLISGTYQQPGTFISDNTTYYNYILSTEEITQNTTYPINEVGSHNITLLTDMSSYHDNATIVTINSDRITTGTAQNYDQKTFFYDNGTYMKYVTSKNGALSQGAIDINSVNLLTSVSDYRSTVYTIHIDGSRCESGALYAAPGYYYDANNLVNSGRYYALSTSAMSNGATVTLGTEGISLLTQAQLANYWSSRTILATDVKTRITSGTYEAGTFTFGGKTYADRVVLTKEWPNEKIYMDDDFVQILTTEQLQNDYTVVKHPLNRRAERITDQTAYNANGTITFNENTYTGFVKLTSAWPSGTVYAEDNTNVFLTQAQLNEYLNSTTTYYINDGVDLYKSTDNNVSRTKLVASQQYTLASNETFWIEGERSYEAITSNTTYFDSEHTNFTNEVTDTYTFKMDLLNEMINHGSNYTKVKFVNTSTASPKTALTIDPEIVQIINFPNNNQNTNLTNLDLGQATLKLTGSEKFSDMFENPGANYSYSNTLAEVTLPLVSAVGGEVTLPSNAIPVGYNNASAALRTVTVPVGYTKIAEKAFALARPGYTSDFGSAKITTINLPEGLKEIGDEAFYGITNLTNINITGNKVEGRSLVFPSTVATIGESAFEACTSLTSTKDDPFILPRGLKKIKASAFVELTELKFLKLNENLEYVGSSAFGLTSEIHAQTTITFPSTIKYLGPGSFVGRWYQDIYFTGQTAPVCPVGAPTYSGYSSWGNVTAFSANTQMGNNGFNKIKTEGSTADDANGTGYANRENYINNGYYFTILHFPDGLSADNAKTYRDITRRYVAGTGSDGVFQYDENIATMIDPATIVPGSDGETFGSAFKEGTTGGKSNLVYYMSKDGEGLLEESANAETLATGFIDTYLGTQQIWPSQSQWTRNFVTVANGVEWDGVTKYRPEVTEDMFDMMKADGLFVKANSLDYSTKRVADANNSNEYGHDFSLANITWSQLNDGTDEHKRMLDYLSLILYQGTRRFVLSYDGGYDIPFKIKLKGGRWWSICLPFNMTKAEVDEVFGGKNEGTHVCLMSGVDRKVSESGNTLVLKFKNDVYRHKTVRTVTEASDGKSFTYTYEKNFNESNDPPGANDIVIYARESYMIYPVRVDAGTNPVEYDFGSPVFERGNPLPTIVYSNSNAPYTTQNGEDPAYRFIGNFTTSTGNDGEGNAITIKIPQYSYAYGRTSSSASLDKSKFFILETAGATWSPFKSIVQNTADGGGAADWLNFFQQNTARVNQVSLFGDDEEVTGIDNVIIEVSSDNDEDLRVFNLNGSMMGNSLQGLPAGTYIQGGKAYRVK